jgi:hypothetical protein
LKILDLAGYPAGERGRIEKSNGIDPADALSGRLPESFGPNPVRAYDTDSGSDNSPRRVISPVDIHLDTQVRK